MSLTDEIIGISIGIRYLRSFRIPDISGELIDDILHSDRTPSGEDIVRTLQGPHSDRTPSGEDIFRTLQGPLSREKVLSSPINNEYLRINTDDLLLGIKVTDHFERKINWLTTAYHIWKIPL